MLDSEAVCIVCRPSVLDSQILALNPTEIAQPLFKCHFRFRWPGAHREVTDARRLLWLLRLRGEVERKEHNYERKTSQITPYALLRVFLAASALLLRCS